ncbi:polar amino acid ABC transporter, inner membrane subunit [Paenibacillus curdlanolyticus YK9]|uniref:Polar amino acid ABC transporter, inner membrane subunit n=1 Tax=Paenibacillus curdlanolyticus YK9 TaxID=717606 RepID=E0I7Y3_9BACL|nr:polar amino acid ABC transporter, inner membrane subunit [Paenibacillus curdlanolyticus YK9]
MGRRFDIHYLWQFIPKLLGYLEITLFIVAASMLLGFLVGFLIALPRMYNVPILRTVSRVYVSFFRGTPILIQLFLIYYGLPELLKGVGVDVSKLPVLVFVILTYGLHTGAFISETIRAGVGAVDRGQTEAALAIGMTGYQSFLRIVLPQAVAVSMPVVANLVIANLKDTSLAFSLGVMEMTGKSQTLGQATQHFIEVYIALSAIYFAVSMVLESLFKLAERRLLRHEARQSNSWGEPSKPAFLSRWWDSAGGLVQRFPGYRQPIGEEGPALAGAAPSLDEYGIPLGKSDRLRNERIPLSEGGEGR